jgi:hypothetical protein
MSGTGNCCSTINRCGRHLQWNGADKRMRKSPTCARRTRVYHVLTPTTTSGDEDVFSEQTQPVHHRHDPLRSLARDDDFHQYTKDKRPSVKKALAETICDALEIHATLEEEIFYPVMRPKAQDQKVMEKSEPEHMTRCAA